MTPGAHGARHTGMPNAEFQAAVDRVNGLSKDPGNDTKLRMYALYK